MRTKLNNLSKLVMLLLMIATTVFAQDITNTLGAGGLFKIKDASNDYLTLTQATGQVNILKTLRLETTTSSTTGVIFKGNQRFIHDFGTNTFMGSTSGNFTMTSANLNTGIGEYSLESLTTGDDNTAVGYFSLRLNTTGSYNTAVGRASLSSNTTGTYNTAMGSNSLNDNTTGSYNTALGTASLQYNTTGSYNIALGVSSLQYNTTGFSNTSVGYQSLYSNTTGYKNVALGDSSLNKNTTGNNNTALGFQSLYSNTTGSSNTANGNYTLRSNTTGNDNTANGYDALYSNTTGFSNTANGYDALNSNTSGYNNTALGRDALGSNTIGFSNTALGYTAGNTITSGGNLTCIGFNAQPSAVNATNQITLGNAGITSLRCNVQTITSLSDARDKKNINDLNLGIDFLMKIKPRQFNWDKREWYDDNASDGSKMKEEPTAGFIAQELDEVQTTENSEWLNLVLKDNPEKWEATPGNLLPIMVKAIQELKIKNEQLKIEKNEEIAVLQNKNQNLEERLAKFEEMQTVLAKKIERIESSEQLIKVQIVNSEYNNQ